MPGVAPVAPLGPLPAIPAATAGMPSGPGVALSELGTALSQVPAQIEKNKLEQSQLEEAQQRIKDATRADAMKRLQLGVQMGRGSKQLLYNPDYISFMDQAAKDSGFGPGAPTVDETIPGTSTTRKMLDINAFIPKKTLDELPQGMQEYLWQLSPQQRVAQLGVMGYDMSDPAIKAFADAPRHLTPAEQNNVTNKLYSIQQQGFEQKWSPTQYQSAIQSLAALNDLPNDVTQQLISDPTVLQQAGNATKLQLSRLGLLNKKTEADINRATSLSELAKSQSKYYVEKTAMLPQELQLKWADFNRKKQQGDAQIANASTRLDLALTNAQNVRDARAFSEFKGAIHEARVAADTARAQYTSAQKFIDTATANGQPVSQEMLDQRDALKSRLDKLETDANQADAMTPQLLKQSTQSYFGTQQTVTNVRPQGVPAGAQYGKAKGKVGYLYPDGMFHPNDGSAPYKP